MRVRMSRIWRFAKNVLNGWLEADAFSLAATWRITLFSASRRSFCSRSLSPLSLSIGRPPSSVSRASL
jgi:hypothetical protein